MRNRIFYFIFCLTGLTTFSQNFNYDIHTEYNTAPANIVLHKNNLYFTSIHQPSGGSVMLDFYSYNNSGTFRFKKSFPFPEALNVAKLLVTNDSNIAFFGYSNQQCDAPQIYPFLMKLDTNGQVLISKTYSTSPMIGAMPIDGCQLANNDYYLVSSNKIFRINSAGTYINYTNHFDTICSVTPYNNGSNVMINAVNTNFFGPGVNNFILTPTLSIVTSYSTSNYYKKIIPNKGSYFALTTNGYIEKLDTTFHATGNTIGLQNYSAGNSIYDFTITKDTLYAVGYKNTFTSGMVIRTDTNLVLISNNQNNSPQHLPKSLVTSSTTAYIFANNKAIIPHISLTAIPKNSIYTFNNDIKLVAITIDSSYTIHTFTNSGAAMVDIKFKAKIKNVSNVLLNSFYLSADLGDFSGPCYKRLFHKNYNNLSISPGDSITVLTDPFTGLLTAYYFPNYVTLSNICFVATAPNGKNDNNPLDNVNCPAISLNTTGIHENSNTAIQLNVYPNPVNDRLTISSDNTINFSKAEIRNNIGQLVKEVDLKVNDKQPEINVKDLSSGLYLLNLKTSNNISINRRFIIAH